MCVCVSMYVHVYLLQSEDQIVKLHRVMRFLESVDILAEPHSFKGLFEDEY